MNTFTLSGPMMGVPQVENIQTRDGKQLQKATVWLNTGEVQIPVDVWGQKIQLIQGLPVGATISVSGVLGNRRSTSADGRIFNNLAMKVLSVTPDVGPGVTVTTQQMNPEMNQQPVYAPPVQQQPPIPNNVVENVQQPMPPIDESEIPF